jgi:hypothetical protein
MADIAAHNKTKLKLCWKKHSPKLSYSMDVILMEIACPQTLVSGFVGQD